MAKQEETQSASATTAAATADNGKKAEDKKTADTAGTQASTSSSGGSQSGASNASKAGESQQGGGQSAQASAGQNATGQNTTDGIELLKADHRKVDALFKAYESASSDRKSQLIEEICGELILHTRLEEEIFYPACREAASDEEPLNEAQVEHDGAKVLIADLLDSDDSDPYRDAKLKVLAEQVRHHVAEEEKAGSGVFAKAKAAGVDTQALGRELRQRKDELTQRQGAPWPTALVSLDLSELSEGQPQEEYMARQQGGRDRDEQGRFTSDDDRGRSRGGRDDDRGGYRSRGGRDDNDGRGWYGDSQGHSEASRRGWETRGGGESRSFRDDDDDRGYRSRGNDRERDEYGRFMSEDDDRGGRGGRSSGGGGGRGQGGWFGDSEGHSDAARKGWEDRDSGYRSRGGRDDDDRGGRGRSSGGASGGGRGRSQGGWFGDSEGHAEAARRGWEDRR